ncbi:hypothetical protein TEA_029455 [Camellia sinensis var. sinensis]|uniref:DNA-directed RNA polymerase n=1 Tax=Camellia sinensis var. sinensis TaxID=542762 RepID=A0A4S4ETU3_CAMSN|nr:hypothetical protein TEA_029455 [Camellia sinensis var. sinensis]
MSEVVEALKPLPNLKDMASSSYYFQTMQADRSSPNARNGLRTHVGSFSRNGQQHPRRLLHTRRWFMQWPTALCSLGKRCSPDAPAMEACFYVFFFNLPRRLAFMVHAMAVHIYSISMLEAAAVNLVAGEKPADVYSEIAARDSMCIGVQATSRQVASSPRLDRRVILALLVVPYDSGPWEGCIIGVAAVGLAYDPDSSWCLRSLPCGCVVVMTYSSWVHDIMVRDSNKDPATSPNALLAKLLIGQVDRKLVKQTVMTSVYGVTYVGAREQIKRRLEEKGQITDDGLLFNAACYAAKTIGEDTGWWCHNVVEDTVGGCHNGVEDSLWGHVGPLDADNVVTVYGVLLDPWRN